MTSPAQAGAEAEAIRSAEVALARQNSVAAQIDLQVITAVLNARGTHAEGVGALDRLQQEIEAAVSNWTDLDTPAGARAFQRYLIDKVVAIRTVLDTADLDATSKAALAAALTALYGAATPGPDEPAAAPAPPAPGPGAAAALTGAPGPPDLSGAPGDAEPPGIDQPVEPDAGTAPAPPAPVATPAPAAAIPGGGWGGGLPGGGGLSSLPGLSGLGREIGPLGNRREAQDDAGERSGESDGPAEPSADRPAEPLPDDGAVVIRLPGGQTVTAPSPELAAVITAAVAGTPIADAFRQQGIAIPPPGSAIAALVAPDQLIAGDIGVLADRHALALGDGKALLDNQIRDVADIAGPGFVGWQHPSDSPPVPPAAPAPAPAPGAVPS